jgi:hypothetical protein
MALTAFSSSLGHGWLIAQHLSPFLCVSAPSANGKIILLALPAPYKRTSHHSHLSRGCTGGPLIFIHFLGAHPAGRVDLERLPAENCPATRPGGHRTTRSRTAALHSQSSALLTEECPPTKEERPALCSTGAGSAGCHPILTGPLGAVAQNGS